MAVNKPIAIGVSIVLCVGVVIGVVAIVQHSNSKDDKEDVSAQKKAVTNMCSSTSHQDTCEKTLSSTNSQDPKELMSKAVTATEDAIKKFFDHINSLTDKAKDNNKTEAALKQCKTLVEYSMDSLKQTLSGVKDADVANFSNIINDLRTWLSIVVSHGETCLDGFNDESSTKEINRDAIAKAMQEADQLNLITLEIVTKLNEILPKFGINLNLDIPNTQRRLLSSSDDEYPDWFSAADRKLLAAPPPKPDAVVGQGGQYKTIMDAINAIPKGSKARYTIYVKAGTYNEFVLIPKQCPSIFMYGDGQDKTIVTGKLSTKGTGTQTMQSSSFGVESVGFMAKDMGFENTAGIAGEQAVAFRANADKTAVFNCKIVGYQDTFYLQSGRQFYKNCKISGTIDFIFGDSAAVIQDSEIIVRKPGKDQQNTITAPGKKEKVENTGLVIHRCKVTAEPGIDKAQNPTYLGRPWKPYGTAVFMETDLGDVIEPQGWLEWKTKPEMNNQCYLAEYNNRGASANLATRISWSKKGIDKATASQFTVEKLLQSNQPWLQETGETFQAGLTS